MSKSGVRLGGRTVSVSRLADGRYRVDGRTLAVRVFDEATVRVTDEEHGATSLVTIARGPGGQRWAFTDGETFVAGGRRGGRTSPAEPDDDSLSPPMPTTVRQVAVAVGDRVGKGDVLMVLEAMKMEFAVRASRDGRIAAVHAREGETLAPGTRAVEIEADES